MGSVFVMIGPQHACTWYCSVLYILLVKALLLQFYAKGRRVSQGFEIAFETLWGSSLGFRVDFRRLAILNPKPLNP